MRIIIADDDKQIREGMKEGIDWSSLEIDKVIPAANGIEAFELFTKYLPEIVVTDIRMPGIDGLELFKKIKEVNSSTKVIIISAYSDFEYLKKAIQLGAVDYELKPIKVRNFISLIKKVKDDILKEKVSAEKFKKHLDTYKENFIINLLEGKINDRNIILEGLEQYLKFDGRGNFVCCLIQIDDYYSMTENELKNKISVVRDLIIKNLLKLFKGRIIQVKNQEILIIIRASDSTLFNFNLTAQIKNHLDVLNIALKSEEEITLSAGISKFGNIYQLNTLYKNSRDALDFRLYSGKASINLYDSIEEIQKDNLVFLQKKEIIKKDISEYNLDSVSAIISDEFDRVKTERCYTRSSIIKFCTDIVRILMIELKSNNIGIEQYVNDKIKGLEIIEPFEFVEDYKNYVLNVYKYVLNQYADMRTIKYNAVILKAVRYIKENYSKDLTIENVSLFVKKTPNYFSHLFKKEVGISFSEYVNKIRIYKAKELLLNSDLLIYEIAEKVGYKDYVYFTQIFKKIEGYPPTHLRKGNY